MLIPWVLNEKKPLSILKKERLTAGDMLQVRKVAKHVYEKLFLNENDKEYDDDYLTDVSPNSIVRSTNSERYYPFMVQRFS